MVLHFFVYLPAVVVVVLWNIHPIGLCFVPYVGGISRQTLVQDFLDFARTILTLNKEIFLVAITLGMRRILKCYWFNFLWFKIVFHTKLLCDSSLIVISTCKAASRISQSLFCNLDSSSGPNCPKDESFVRSTKSAKFGDIYFSMESLRSFSASTVSWNKREYLVISLL